MSDESDSYDIDDEIDIKKHDKLVEEVLNLNKIQNVKKPSRTEPTLNISEFSLVQSVTGNKGSIQLDALTEVLKGRKKHEVISNKVKSTNSKSKTLPAPLEKPQADRIRRSINYEKSMLKFDRWEATVTSNRVAPQLIFPLNSTEKLKIIEKNSETFPSTWRVKSELQTNLEKLKPKIEEYHVNQEEENHSLTLEELKERRKEAAKLRAHQSFKEAKARRQNKIKSKKYHRILRKEKIKQKLKEFAELQKTNPEEALKRLEDIEKARAEERFSLRHKGTGQWAKNKQIRAKYDKESRQVLAQQLAISRELTQKLKNVASDSEEEEENDVEEKFIENNGNDDNHWVSGVKPSKEVTDFVSGYKKYWNEKNSEDNNIEQKEFENLKNGHECVEKPKESENLKNETMNFAGKQDDSGVSKNKLKSGKSNKKKDIEDNKVTEKIKLTKSKIKSNTISNKKKSISTSNDKEDNKVTEKIKLTKTKTKNNTISNKKKSVSTSNDVEDIFNAVEKKLEKKLKTKQKRLRSSKSIKKKKVTTVKNDTKKIDLTLHSKIKKPIIDEPMIEEQGKTNGHNENSSEDIHKLKSLLDIPDDNGKSSDNNPDKFTPVKRNNIEPDNFATDENEVNNQREIMLQTMKDDDLAEEFRKEKENEVKKDTPEDIHLEMPGWGSWGGTNISTKRKRRFIIKMPKKIPRKDDNKGFVIINEKAQCKAKPHMVSEVSFPFKTVKDFEASMRAPISNTFVPETAFRKLTEPSVITKMGAIIEPITKSILIGKKKV